MSDTVYICITGVATPSGDPTQDIATFHGQGYYNGPEGTQAQMDAWCANPTRDGLVTDKTPVTQAQVIVPKPHPVVLAQSGINAVQITALVASIACIIIAITRRKP